MQDTEVLISTVGHLPYIGIFFLFFLANVAIPVPEEIFIIILGYTGGIGIVNLFIAIPIAIIGFFLSDIVVFSLAKSNNKYITRIRDRLMGGFTEKDKNFLEKHIIKAIFFSRFLVGFRFIGPVFSGTLRIPLRKFMMYNFLALLIYVPTLVFLGYYFQDTVSLLVKNVGTFRHYFFFVSVLVIFIVFSGALRVSFFRNMRKLVQSKEE